MTEVFEKWGKVISDAAKDVTKKTGEVVEVVVERTEKIVEEQKLKRQIRTMERNCVRDFKDIGKILYYKHRKGEEIDPQCVELCETIAERELAIEELKAEIEKLKEDI
jgi:hypothetical protein